MSAATKAPRPPKGQPIPGVTTDGDVNWALGKAASYLQAGGDRSDPRFVDYIDLWLDYRLMLRATRPKRKVKVAA